MILWHSPVLNSRQIAVRCEISLHIPHQLFTSTSHLDQQWIIEHLDGLESADSNYHNSHKPIDVFIGFDYYWSIVTGDTIVGSHGLVATPQPQKLDWLLSSSLDSHSDTVLTQSHLVLNGDFIDQPSRLESDALITMLHHFGTLNQ